jgi:hypothetical protein
MSLLEEDRTLTIYQGLTGKVIHLEESICFDWPHLTQTFPIVLSDDLRGASQRSIRLDATVSVIQAIVDMTVKFPIGRRGSSKMTFSTNPSPVLDRTTVILNPELHNNKSHFVMESGNSVS